MKKTAIYTILSKHFMGEASPEETQQVLRFKEENAEEYRLLQSLWERNDIHLTEFDTAKAWQKVRKQTTPVKTYTMYSYLKFAATSVAAAILLMLAFNWFYQKSSNDKLIEKSATVKVKKVTLKDGSVIHLNRGAHLTYPKRFKEDKRYVSLRGEAYFEIAKDADRPFIIYTNHSEVIVLGTSFNINTQADQTEISIVTGRLEVVSASNNQTTILNANQTVLVDATSLKTFTTTDKNYLSWKTGIFQFEKANISQVVDDLNTYYNDKIKLINTDSDCLLSATFMQQDLREVLEIIELSCNLQLSPKNGFYELH